MHPLLAVLAQHHFFDEEECLSSVDEDRHSDTPRGDRSNVWLQELSPHGWQQACDENLDTHMIKKMQGSTHDLKPCGEVQSRASVSSVPTTSESRVPTTSESRVRGCPSCPQQEEPQPRMRPGCPEEEKPQARMRGCPGCPEQKKPHPGLEVSPQQINKHMENEHM